VSGIVVVGGSGFVGRAVLSALRHLGVSARPLAAPRLHESQGGRDGLLGDLAVNLEGAAAVVNAAGVARATAIDDPVLWAANAELPGTLLNACRRAGVPRMVHVSSAAVQGRRPELDSSWEHAAFSSYSASKAAGEDRLRTMGGDDWTIFRPGGVHGASRSVTRAIARLAQSPIAIAPRTPQPSPQALIENVASAAAWLAVHDGSLPKVVHHPSEGMTTHSVLQLLGGKEPRLVPDRVADLVLAAGLSASHTAPPLAGLERRLSTLWAGQRQAPSWLTQAGWRPVTPPEQGWRQLGMTLRRIQPQPSKDLV